MENLFTPPWLELPPEITSTILQKLGTIEILRNADKVCTTWRRLCEDPAMWRVINMRDNVWDMLEGYLEQICREAVDRSQGQLIDINLEYFGSDNLLYYIAERSHFLTLIFLFLFSLLYMLNCLTLESVYRYLSVMLGTIFN